MNEPYYVVVREYNGTTAKKTLWQVLTRRMTKDEAERWKEYEEGRPGRNNSKRIFIVPLPEGFFP